MHEGRANASTLFLGFHRSNQHSERSFWLLFFDRISALYTSSSIWIVLLHQCIHHSWYLVFQGKILLMTTFQQIFSLVHHHLFFWKCRRDIHHKCAHNRQLFCLWAVKHLLRWLFHRNEGYNIYARSPVKNLSKFSVLIGGDANHIHLKEIKRSCTFVTS